MWSLPFEELLCHFLLCPWPALRPLELVGGRVEYGCCGVGEEDDWATKEGHLNELKNGRRSLDEEPLARSIIAGGCL